MFSAAVCKLRHLLLSHSSWKDVLCHCLCIPHKKRNAKSNVCSGTLSIVFLPYYLSALMGPTTVFDPPNLTELLCDLNNDALVQFQLAPHSSTLLNINVEGTIVAEKWMKIKSGHYNCDQILSMHAKWRQDVVTSRKNNNFTLLLTVAVVGMCCKKLYTLSFLYPILSGSLWFLANRHKLPRWRFAAEQGYCSWRDLWRQMGDLQMLEE